MNPFLSIISVTLNDAWSLTKTSRSVFRQSFKNFEYIIVDGKSTDGTSGLIEFWQVNGLVKHALSEPDRGVYDAMNKGLRLAKGRFVCFLNAGDVFADDDVLSKVYTLLQDLSLDGVLGWGELNGQIWASWIENSAFKLSSLGFCHQALFAKRLLLLEHPFDERSIKTDSDTLQLGHMYTEGASIAIVPEIWAIRGGEQGISANLERTKTSILNTLTEEYPELTVDSAEQIIMFRRQCVGPDRILSLMTGSTEPLRSHLGYMILDTLFLPQSLKLKDDEAETLFDSARNAISQVDPKGALIDVDRLLQAQSLRSEWLTNRANTAKEQCTEIATFHKQEVARIAKSRTSTDNEHKKVSDIAISLTSFPARISTLHFVIQSLIEQTCRPREIHIWLGADEIKNRSWLPQELLKFEAHGLKIHFAPRTFHQYDKFLHNSAINKDKPFIIVDDDVIYPPDSIASLLEMHRTYPTSVIANRCHLIGISQDGNIKPYAEWEQEVRINRPNLRAYPTGAGGVLYPPEFMNDPMVSQVSDILAHAPYADDIWLKMCALAKGIPTMTTPLSKYGKWYIRYTTTTRAGALYATNNNLGLNDIQITRSLEWLTSVRKNWRQELLEDKVE